MWALSLVCAVLTFLPRPDAFSPYSPDKIRAAITAAAERKYQALLASFALLVLSLVWLVVAAWVYLDVYVVK